MKTGVMTNRATIKNTAQCQMVVWATFFTA